MVENFKPGHYVVIDTNPTPDFPNEIVAGFKLEPDGTGLEYNFHTKEPVYHASWPNEGIDKLVDWSCWGNGRLRVTFIG